MMTKRGQTSLEALIVVILLFVLFLGVYLFYSLQKEKVIDERDIVLENDDCLLVARAIITLAMFQGNARQQVVISSSLTIYPFTQRITTEHLTCTFPVAFAGNTTTVTKGEVVITKQGEVITFNNV